MSKMREDPFYLPCAAPIPAGGLAAVCQSGDRCSPSWHTLSYSQADFLAFPAARTKRNAERPAQQALCTKFKHTEA